MLSRKYKDFTGNDDCVLCPVGKTYDADHMPTSVPTGVLMEDSCFDCAADNYYHMNEVTGTGECLACHGNSVSTAGALNQFSCVFCGTRLSPNVPVSIKGKVSTLICASMCLQLLK